MLKPILAKTTAALAVAAVLVLPAAVADQNSAKDQNGDPCLKINCEGGTIENHCDRPVNFAACHAESRSGCLLNIKSGAQIAPKESLPFACKPGNLAQADGCFPPFVPVSFSALQSGCIPDPENPDALTAAAAASTAPQSAPVPQAPKTAPPPEPAAAPEPDENAATNPSRNPSPTAKSRSRNAKSAKPRPASAGGKTPSPMKAPPNSADSKKNTAESGSFLNATGDLLHALSLIGAAYLVSQGKNTGGKIHAGNHPKSQRQNKRTHPTASRGNCWPKSPKPKPNNSNIRETPKH